MLPAFCSYDITIKYSQVTSAQEFCLASKNITMLTTENSTELAPMTGPTTPYFYEFLDETKRKIAQIAMDYVIIFCVFVLGVVTNILVILVYAK